MSLASVTTPRVGSLRRVGTPSWDSGTFLSLLLALLLIIPSRFVFRPLGGEATPSAVLGLLALWLWVQGRIVPSLGMARGRQPLRAVVLFFLLANLASWTATATELLSPDQVRGADRGLLVVGAAAGIVLFTADGLTERRRLDAVLQRVVVLVGIVAVLGILQFAVGLDLPTHFKLPGLTRISQTSTFIGSRDGFRRVASTTAHPIEFGLILTTTLPIALHYAFATRLTRRRRRVATACAALIAVAIPTAVSRSAAVATLLVLVMLVPTWPLRRRVRVLGAAVAGAGGFVLAQPGLLRSIADLFTHTSTDSSIQGRIAFYSQLPSYFHAHPLFGQGFGTFDPTMYGFSVDNQFLTSLVETGAFGVAAVAVLVLAPAAVALSVRHRCKEDPETRSLAHALLTGFLVAVVGFVSFDALSFTMFTYLFCFFMGAAGALWQLESGGPRWATMQHLM
ncbi:MAG: O-antigen ligase family protein [Acidimicrobiales bacterium]